MPRDDTPGNGPHTSRAGLLDAIRARTSLRELVGRSVNLVDGGREWRGRCPFHADPGGSFYVAERNGYYHCDACSAHGDAARWLVDHHGLSFIDAVKQLAAAAGLEVPPSIFNSIGDPAGPSGGAVALRVEVLAAAGDWFAQLLDEPVGEHARRYLEARGIGAEVARSFGLGFAPDGRGSILRALAAFPAQAVGDSDLLIALDDKPPYARFRGRLMVPVRDADGVVIGFTGRLVGAGEPRFLHSPDGPRFEKTRVLFNLDRAAAAARSQERLILVEGPFDVITLAGAGIDEVVAPMGTAVTAAHLETIWSIAAAPLLCFDGDAAGRRAARNAALRALPLLSPTRSLAFVTMPDRMDPDDLVRRDGVAAFEDRVAAAVPIAEFFAATIIDDLSVEGRNTEREALNCAADLSSSIAHPDVRSDFFLAAHRAIAAAFGN